MDGTNFVKGVIRFAAATAVSAVVGQVLKMNTPKPTGIYDKVLLAVGGGIISNMLGEQGGEYIIKQIDEVGKFMPKA